MARRTSGFAGEDVEVRRLVKLDGEAKEKREIVFEHGEFVAEESAVRAGHEGKCSALVDEDHKGGLPPDRLVGRWWRRRVAGAAVARC